MEKYTIFRGTKVIVQPSVCFVYNKQNNIFDVFNKGALFFIEYMNGVRKGEMVVSEVKKAFPKIDDDIIISDYMALISYLNKRGYIEISVEPREEYNCVELRGGGVKPVYADIELTRNCNLSCAYCYANVKKGRQEKDLSFDEWKKILIRLKENGLRVVKISGGEPFLYKEIKRFVEFCASNFIVSINTNGWFIDGKVAEWLSKLHLQCVQISLDSSSKTWHDKVRGRGTWERAIEAIKNLHHFKVPLRISSTICNGNKEEINELQNLANKFQAEINFEIMKPVGRAKALDKKWFIDNACEVMAHNTIPLIYKSLDYLEVKCQAQIGFIGISSRGNIKPCNLPESFFMNLEVPVISPVSERFSYANSKTYNTTEDYCKRVVAAQSKENGRPYDRCIFYCKKTTS